MVLCAVGGVQSQSMTVDRQMKRYHVPRLAFINKMDRIGANPLRVVRAGEGKAGMRRHSDAAADRQRRRISQGIVDLITMQAVYFDGTNGEKVRREEIPADMQEDAKKYRHADVGKFVDVQRRADGNAVGRSKHVPEELIHAVVKDAVQNQDATAVFMGSAYQEQRRAAAAGRDCAVSALAAGSTKLRPRTGKTPTKKFRWPPIRPSRSSAWRSSWSTIRTVSSRSCASIRAR